MAYIDKIWFHRFDDKAPLMRVYVKLKPAGEVNLTVDVPEAFYQCIMDMAQAAADLHEQKMKAEILAQNEKG